MEYQDNIKNYNLSSENVKRTNGIVHKIIPILALQLTLTAVFIIAGQISYEFRRFLIHYSLLPNTSAFIAFTANQCLLKYEKLSQIVSLKYLLLILSATSSAHYISAYAFSFDTTQMLQAALMTTLATLTTLAYAMALNNELSLFGSFLFIFCFGTSFVFSLHFFFRSYLIETLFQKSGVLMCSYNFLCRVKEIIFDKEFKYGLDKSLYCVLEMNVEIIFLLVALLKHLQKLKN